MTTRSLRNQYPWIDVVKSIGVYLVVLGHLLYQGSIPIINQLIYSFHMPLFFILSGYLYKFKDNETNSEFIKKKFLRTALPALIWILITLPIYFFTEQNINSIERIKRFIFFDGFVPYNDPCWFFIVLFFVFIVVRFIRSLITDTAKSVVINVIILFLGFILYIFEVHDYFMMKKTVICLGFFMMGNNWHKCIMRINRNFKTSFYIAASAISLVLWLVFGIILNDKVSLYKVDLGNYWSFIFSGLFGTLFFCGSIKILYVCLDKTEKQLFVEKYPVSASIFIVCSHFIPITVYRVLMNKMGLFYSFTYNIVTPIFCFLLIVCYYPFSRIISRKIPILNGELK